MLTTRTRLKVLSEIAEEQEDSLCSATVEEDSPFRSSCVVPDAAEDKKEKRRRKVTEELFETEKTYIQHLELAHKFFEFPLRFNCLISEQDHSMLFSNLEQILEVNTKLLEYMEQTTVGTAFKFLGPFLKLYSMYAKSHQEATKILQENIAKNEKFADFIREQEERPELTGLKVGALLITPVQRIPRYKLLLEDLLENTSQDHHDYAMLKEAAKQVGEIALHINEHVRQYENFQKMLAIYNSFDNTAPKILVPGREFLREGKLHKVSRRGRYLERMFFLFSDMLMYGKPKLLDSGNSSYTCCCVLPLRHCQVEKVLGAVNSVTGGGMFRITCKKERLLLKCSDPEEARAWVDTIEASIKKISTDRQTLRKPSSNKEPVRGKSLLKMRLREKKQDLKRKLQSSGRSNKSSSSEGRKRSPLKIMIESLSPRKRQRTTSDGARSSGSSADSYSTENEINLDSWDPDTVMFTDNDSDDDAGSTNSDVGMILKENPPFDQDGFDTICEETKENEGDSVNVSRRGSRLKCEEEQPDLPSEPWFNPVFQQQENELCATYPIRRALKTGSRVKDRISSVLNGVRHNKACVLM